MWDEIISFTEEAELLKSVTRSSWMSSGRRESTAEHSWRLCLLSMVSLPYFPELNRERALKLCIIHDLGETYTGDISAAASPDAEKKRADEESTVKNLCSLLPADQSEEVMSLWQEYEAGETPEARFVRAMDKAETILQHCQGKNPEDVIQYAFNLEYGKALFATQPLTELRKILDAKTQAKVDESRK